ncbi:MAG: hypothetical protein K8I27_00255 [Planctomycetes bacterium]|nr:hypothetical protein [Planctomycetota bacterium]
MRRKRITLGVLVALLVVLAGSVIYTFFWPLFPGRSSDIPVTPVQGGPPPKSARSSTIVLEMPGIDEKHDVDSAARVADKTDAAPRQYSTEILFSAQGAPAPDVAFEVHLRSTVDNRYGHRSSETRYGVSDENGTARILSGSTAFTGTVKVSDEDWAHTGPVAFSGAEFACLEPRSNDGTPQVMVEVLGLVPVELRLVYDDGKAFSGTASVRSESQGFSRGSNIGESGRHTFKLPVADLKCWTRPERPGYETVVIPIAAAQIFDGAVVEIVVKRSERKFGNANVNTRALTGGQASWWFQLSERDKGRVVESATRTSVEVGDMRPFEYLSPGWYVLLAGCGDKVSRVEFEVLDAAVTEVVLDRVFDPATARVVIQDEQGHALDGAVLRIAGRWGVGYPARDVTGTVAVSDSTGAAKLTHLHPDTTRLLVEAYGYQAREFDVSVSSGTMTDLGTVRLDVATGRIDVQIQNMTPGKTYTIGCLDPYSSGVGTNTKICDTDTYVYEKLPFKWYTIFITLEAGGKVHSQNVELKPDAPTATVILDASEAERRNAPD